ncbi:MAG: hypothetical protein QM731_22110 [Chitinophagaceae bacterium]
MVQQTTAFKIVFNEQPIQIRVVPHSSGPLYMASGQNIPTVCIHKATNFEGQLFWTSIPEGKQKLAESIGPLIDEFYHNH